MVADMVQIQVQYPGYYRLYPRMAHDSGDDQLNESYFLTVHHSDGTVSTPEDPNAGLYRVVADSVGMDTVSVFENAGLFYFKQGLSTIRLHHYAEIYQEYPQFLHPPMGGTTQHAGAESVYIDSVLTVIAEPRIDGAVATRVLTDRVRAYNDELRQVAYPGEQVTIAMRARNIDENNIRFATLTGTIPVSLENLQFSVAPKESNGNTLLWDVPELAPLEDFTVEITGRLAATMPDGYTLLECPAELNAPHDRDLANNTDVTQFWSLTDNGGPYQEKADLALVIDSVTDSLAVSGQDTVKIALEKQEIHYSLTVTNVSPDTAINVSIAGKLSALIDYQSADIPPAWQSGDSLQWTYPLFAPYEVKVISLIATVKENLPLPENLVITRGYVTAANDTLAQNNTDADTVTAIQAEPEADLALTMQIQTGMTASIDNNTVKATYPGEQYPVALQVTNNGPDIASDVILWCLQPDSVVYNGFSIPPTITNGDTLFWQFAALAPSAVQQVQFTVNVSAQVSVFPFLLPHWAEINYPFDLNPANNSAQDRVYIIEYIPPPPQTDVAITMHAITDTTVIINNRERNAVKPGSIYQYRVSLNNAGIHPAQSLQIIQKLPANVQFNSTTLQPFQLQGDSLVWNLAELLAGSNAAWLVNVTLSGAVPDGVDWLISTIRHTALNDSIDANNSAADTVRVVRKPAGPDGEKTDLALQMASITDTTVTDGGREWHGVKPGGEYQYRLTINNNGPNAADTIEVMQKLPANVSFQSAAITPYRQQGDSLFWRIQNLATEQDTTWTVNVALSNNVPVSINWLTSTAALFAVNDSTTTNNTAADTVRIVRKPAGPDGEKTDLALQMASITDTTVTDGGREWHGVKPGGEYQYRLTINNNGPNAADTIEVMQKLPANVSFQSAAITPYRQQGDSLFWRIQNLATEQDTTWTVNVTLSGSVPVTVNWLTSRALLSAVNDSTDNNNSAADTVRVVHKAIDPGNKNKFDAFVTLEAITDTTLEIEDNIFKAVLAGETFQYQLQVHNPGAKPGGSIKLRSFIPGGLQLSNFSITPVTANDTLFWNIDTLANAATWSVTFSAQAPQTAPEYPCPVNAFAAITAPRDTVAENNTTTTRVYILNKSGQDQFVDVVPQQLAQPDSFALSGADTLKYARESERYRHYVIAKNNGEVTAVNVRITSFFPDSVTVDNFNTTPAETAAGSATWLLDSLPADEQVVFSYDVQVAPWMPVGANMLITRVTISAANENTAQQNNNLSLNTVFNYVPESLPFTPEIQINPAMIDVTDSALVRIRIPVQVAEWDLKVRLPNGQVDSSYADLFIEQNPSPTPDVWLDITDWYNQTKLVSALNEDLVIIQIQAVNRRGVKGTAQAQLVIRSGDHMVLDRNVYKPELEDYVDIRFKLGYQRLARLDVYDVSGRHITKLTEDIYNGGWNSWLWNGMLENGSKAGSGVYLITLQSGDFKDWKKLIIVR